VSGEPSFPTGKDIGSAVFQLPSCFVGQGQLSFAFVQKESVQQSQNSHTYQYRLDNWTVCILPVCILPVCILPVCILPVYILPVCSHRAYHTVTGHWNMPVYFGTGQQAYNQVGLEWVCNLDGLVDFEYESSLFALE
jgi:hypothetical protein